MEGIVEKFESANGYFKSSGWTKYFLILHESVLLIADIKERTKIHGKLHM
jgi:hypothetical protein